MPHPHDDNGSIFQNSLLQEPEFAQGLFDEFLGQQPFSTNMRDFFQGRFNQFFNRFQTQLGRMFDLGQDTSQFTFQDFLAQQPFQNEFASLPPEVAGRLTGRFNPFTRFVFR